MAMLSRQVTDDDAQHEYHDQHGQVQGRDRRGNCEQSELAEHGKAAYFEHHNRVGVDVETEQQQTTCNGGKQPRRQQRRGGAGQSAANDGRRGQNMDRAQQKAACSPPRERPRRVGKQQAIELAPPNTLNIVQSVDRAASLDFSRNCGGRRFAHKPGARPPPTSC